MIYDHKSQQQFLKNFFETEDQGLLLLSGPEGVGKFSLVKELLERKENWEKIFLETEDKFFKIETARLLVSLNNKKTKKRIIVINDSHKFRFDSQNTLLKTFEEFSSKTIFVLITSNFYKILPTIRSRSLILRFGLVSKEKTIAFLKEKGFSLKEINKIWNLYPGQPGKILSLLANKEKLKLIEKFLVSGINEKLLLLDELENNFKLNEFLELYLVFLKNSLKIKDLSKFYSKIKNIFELYFDSTNLGYREFSFKIQIANLILNF